MLVLHFLVPRDEDVLHFLVPRDEEESYRKCYSTIVSKYHTLAGGFDPFAEVHSSICTLTGNCMDREYGG